MKIIINNLLKIIGILFLLQLANCGNEKIKNNSSLNNKDLDLSEENFNKLYLIVENINSKNCDSNEFAQFFNEINIAFIKTNFSIEITKIINDEQYKEFQINYIEPNNCVIKEYENFL